MLEEKVFQVKIKCPPNVFPMADMIDCMVHTTDTPYLLERAPMLERAPPRISAPFWHKISNECLPQMSAPLFSQKWCSFETEHF